MDYEKVCVCVWVFVCVPVWKRVCMCKRVWESVHLCISVQESVCVCTLMCVLSGEESNDWRRSCWMGTAASVWKRKWESWEHRMSLSTWELSIYRVQTHQSGAKLKPRPGLGSRSLWPGASVPELQADQEARSRLYLGCRALLHRDVELTDMLQSWKGMVMHMSYIFDKSQRRSWRWAVMATRTDRSLKWRKPFFCVKSRDLH